VAVSGGGFRQATTVVVGGGQWRSMVQGGGGGQWRKDKENRKLQQ